jgi:hypothetical protein
MKRLFLFALILAALMIACNLPGQETAVPTSNPPPAPTDTAELPPTPTVALTPTIGTNETCGPISFYRDPALASSILCETIPAANGPDPWAMYPEHTKATFQGYMLADRFHTPRITVYPLPAFLALTPDLSTRVNELNALISGGPLGPSALPLLEPGFNAAQEFHAKYQLLNFSGGSGIRFITQYAQFYAPINNHDMFYTFQGITAGGQYWISVVLPISHPTLPANADNPPGGMSWEEFGNQFTTYIANLTPQLDSQPDASYIPSIALLDALIASITVTP